MAIDPIAPPVPAIHLVDTPAPPEPTPDPLKAQLATERSAGKALLAAMRELESRLEAERQSTVALHAQVAQLEQALGSEREAIERRKLQHTELLSELVAANQARIALERRGFIDRVLNR